MANSEIIGAGQDTARPAPKMQYDDVFRFGKHKGKTVVHVLVNDYRYLWWLYIKGIKTFEPKVMDRINEYLEFDEHCNHVSRVQGVYGGADAYEQCAEWL